MKALRLCLTDVIRHTRSLARSGDEGASPSLSSQRCAVLMLAVLVILEGEYEPPRKVLRALVNTPSHPGVNWMRSGDRSRKSPAGVGALSARALVIGVLHVGRRR